MLFNYHYFTNIALLLWGCIFCLILAFCLFLSKNYNRQRRNLLLWMQLDTALLLLSDSLAWYFRGYPGTVGYYMVRISNFLVFAVTDIILMIFHRYVCCRLLKEAEQKRLKRISIAYILATLALTLVVVTQFTHLYYYFDANNYYHRNNAYIISMLLPLCCMLIDLSLLVQYRKRINKKSLLAMSSYIILPIAASIIQVIYYGFSLINLAICGSMILMYIVITGEQNQRLGQLAQDKQELATKFEIASILNRCTAELSSNKDINLAINNLLKIVNDYFRSDRTYIFETDFTRQIVINTYEFTLDHVSEEKDNLQEVPLEVISRWMDKFRESKVYYIPTLEQEKGTMAYEMLEEQNVDRLLAVPLLDADEITGFLGVDNPREHYDDATLLSSIQFFITSSLRRKKEQEYLTYLSYRDTLTMLYNRNKYMEVLSSCEQKTINNTGVVYIDLNGLKKINDEQGHEAGDSFIKAAASVIRNVFPEDSYRIGGDEFVIISMHIDENVFNENIKHLRNEMLVNNISISIGVVWKSVITDLEEALRLADHYMYKEKEEYHRVNGTYHR